MLTKCGPDPRLDVGSEKQVFIRQLAEFGYSL